VVSTLWYFSCSLISLPDFASIRGMDVYKNYWEIQIEEHENKRIQSQRLYSHKRCVCGKKWKETNRYLHTVHSVRFNGLLKHFIDGRMEGKRTGWWRRVICLMLGWRVHNYEAMKKIAEERIKPVSLFGVYSRTTICFEVKSSRLFLR